MKRVRSNGASWPELASLCLFVVVLVFSGAAHSGVPKPSQPQPKGPVSGKSSKTVFVQMFEWPWKDIAQECESYLGPNGFAAVQVSPPTEHLVWHGNPWWERYQPVSYRLESRAGSEAEFREMVSRCNEAGVDIYVDVVLNHMTGIESGVGHVGTPFEHYEYEGLYSLNDFHHCGRNGNNDIRDFTDLYELQNCELLNLADLDTSSSSVQGRLAQYLNRLADMGVKGFRIDAAKHMAPWDIQGVLRRLEKSSYILQELIISPGEPVSQDDYVGLGDITVFPYSFDLGRAFLQGNVGKLRYLGWGIGYPYSHQAIVFLENHDLERNSKYEHEILNFDRHGKLYNLAHVFMLAWPYGYPRIYSSYRYGNYDQGPPIDKNRNTTSVFYPGTDQCREPWVCQHRFPEVAPMVEFRNLTNNRFFITDWWTNNLDQLAFGRGDRGFVVINAARKAGLKRKFQTSLAPGTYCNVLGASWIAQDVEKKSNCPGERIVVNKAGVLEVSLPPLTALAIHIGSKLDN